MFIIISSQMYEVLFFCSRCEKRLAMYILSLKDTPNYCMTPRNEGKSESNVTI